MIRDLPALPGLARLPPSARLELARVVDSLGWRHPTEGADALAALIEHESGWRTDARNPVSGSVGLIQWMPRTAAHFGTTPDQILGMTLEQQLELVGRYFRPFGPGLAPRDVPIAAFLPVFVGADNARVVASRGEKAYDQNAPLDHDGDGAITAGEVRREVFRLLERVRSVPRLPVPSEAVLTADGGGVGMAAIGVLVVAAVALAWKAAT